MLPRGFLTLLLACCLLSACAGTSTPIPVTRPATFTPARPAITTFPHSSQTPGAEQRGHTPTLAVSDQAPTLTLTPPSASLRTGLGPTTLGRIENFVEVGHEPLSGRGWNAGLALASDVRQAELRRLRPKVVLLYAGDGELPAGSEARYLPV